MRAVHSITPALGDLILRTEFAIRRFERYDTYHTGLVCIDRNRISDDLMHQEDKPIHIM